MTTPLPRGSASPSSAPASKSARFRASLLAPELTFLMEAHDGLSAKIVEEAGFPGDLGVGPHGLGGARRARQQRGLLDAGPGGARVHGRRHVDPDPSRRRHRLRQLQQRAPPCPEALPAGRGRRLPRGQALPQDQLVHRRAPAPGRRRRVLRQDQGRQGQRQRPRLLDRRARGGAHRRAGARRGPASGRGVPRGRRRRHPDPQQAPDRRRDPRLRRRVGRPGAPRHRAHDVLRDAGRARSGRPASRS